VSCVSSEVPTTRNNKSTSFEVFGSLMKHSLSFLICYINSSPGCRKVRPYSYKLHIFHVNPVNVTVKNVLGKKLSDNIIFPFFFRIMKPKRQQQHRAFVTKKSATEVFHVKWPAKIHISKQKEFKIQEKTSCTKSQTKATN